MVVDLSPNFDTNLFCPDNYAFFVVYGGCGLLLPLASTYLTGGGSLFSSIDFLLFFGLNLFEPIVDVFINVSLFLS